MTGPAVRRDPRVAGLYALTPDLDDTDLLAALVDAALDGGAMLVQYRHKTASPALRLAQASRLASICAARGRPLIVNDHLDVALAVDGAGLHVGSDDFADRDALHEIRRRLGRPRLLGVSCYRSVDHARDAVAAGADYVAFGSVFPSGTKPAAPAAGLATFGHAAHLRVARVAIGGITADRIPSLVDAGVDAAAVIADLFGDPRPDVVRERAIALRSGFDSRSPRPTSNLPPDHLP